MSNSQSPLVSGPWAGAVTGTTAIIKAVVRGSSTGAQILLSRDPSFQNAVGIEGLQESAPGYPHKIVSFQLAGLEPGTKYYYILEIDHTQFPNQTGQLTTFPAEGAAADFKFVFASCAATGTNSRVFQAILDESPLFFCHLGDFHYENVNSRDVSAHLCAYDEVLQSPRQSNLYRRIPIARIWDDHDFCGNDSDRTKKGRDAATEAFRKYVPHYPLDSHAAGGIYQAFTIGKVRFLLSDMRSQRSPRDEEDNASKTMLGPAQKEWLKTEFLGARKYDLVVWANSVPWIEAPSPDEDSWAGYHTERVELANFIKQNQVDNLCMISGDAHMLAIDKGLNSGYANGRKGGFPVFHAAALKSSPSAKGGKYSEGMIKGDRQYGVFEVKYLNGRLNVFWTGKKYDVSKEQRVEKVAFHFESPGTYLDF